MMATLIKIRFNYDSVTLRASEKAAYSVDSVRIVSHIAFLSASFERPPSRSTLLFGLVYVQTF